MIETNRLILREIDISDAVRINILVNDKKITSTTASIPYPSMLEDTKIWIEEHRKNCAAGKQTVFGVVLKRTDEIIGVVSLDINMQHEQAELAYWIGCEYWKNGYCTEIKDHQFKDVECYGIISDDYFNSRE